MNRETDTHARQSDETAARTGFFAVATARVARGRRAAVGVRLVVREEGRCGVLCRRNLCDFRAERSRVPTQRRARAGEAADARSGCAISSRRACQRESARRRKCSQQRRDLDLAAGVSAGASAHGRAARETDARRYRSSVDSIANTASAATLVRTYSARDSAST